MSLNLHALAEFGWLPAAVFLCLAQPLAAQRPCLPSADSALTVGWRAYRADSIAQAIRNFESARRQCPQNLDALVGLGFAHLRLGETSAADALFSQVLSRDSANPDAWEGRTQSSLRLGDTARAVSAGRRALVLSPKNQEIRALLNRVAPDWERGVAPRRKRAGALEVMARTRGQRFEVLSGGEWHPFYVQGVNFGVALPGRYPSDFPSDSALYAGWLNTLARMNANTIRVYTILPPSFYRALRAWNLSHPERLIWLIHGVWTELPPRYDFNDVPWLGGFENEIRRVVDVVHGGVTIKPRRGHAAGRYDADVSHWVLAYIIGREWEPFAVKSFNQRNNSGGYRGRYLEVRRAPAMDLWLARQCDGMLSYEVDTYNTLRPVAYTNWPTLDPLSHPTEATTEEEMYWRKRTGRRSEARKVEYENDAVGIDANLVVATPENSAGWFAAYHVYPYYPDFINLDPGYRRARSSEGSSAYFGYLRTLVSHHAGIPTLIAEYGVPSSRGIAHFQVQSWDHGGHDERAMAAIDARLTREIREAGAAGSILFAWLDEWFKRNWAVMDYELPADNTRFWHNVMDPEQHYGIIGLYAGEREAGPQLGRDPDRWRSLPLVQRAAVDVPSPVLALRAGADESFLYLALELHPGRFPWDSTGIQLAIDSYQPAVGQHLLPRTQTRSEIGFEFLVELTHPDTAFVRVLPDYNRYDARVDSLTGDDFGRFSRRPVKTANYHDGQFEREFMTINRARFARDGRFYPAQRYDRGRLRYGTARSSSLADWFVDEPAGLVELRIPWDLINVTDPSSRTLLDDSRTTGPFGTTAADAFHLGVELYRKGTRPQLIGALPQPVKGVWAAAGFRPWSWRGWTVPRWHARLKPVYDSLRLLWREVPGEAPALPGRRAPSN